MHKRAIKLLKIIKKNKGINEDELFEKSGLGMDFEYYFDQIPNEYLKLRYENGLYFKEYTLSPAGRDFLEETRKQKLETFIKWILRFLPFISQNPRSLLEWLLNLFGH